jgi:hypothetical protein
MLSRLRKFPLALPAVLAVLALSACGQAHTRVTTGTYAGEGGADAPYLYVGPLIYQVQVSRQLNPFNVEDAAYLQGVPLSERKLEPGQEWFGVFMQVYNTSNLPHQATTDLTVSDTQNNTYTPIPLSATNLFAYRGGLVPANSQLPAPGTIAYLDSAQGQLVLYKIQIASLNNRPMQIKIIDPEHPTETASAELDV